MYLFHPEGNNQIKLLGANIYLLNRLSKVYSTVSIWLNLIQIGWIGSVSSDWFGYMTDNCTQVWNLSSTHDI